MSLGGGGGQEKRKDRKTGKSRKEEKVMGFTLSLPIPRMEIGGSHPGWNQGLRVPDVKEKQGSRYRRKVGGHGRSRARVYSRYIHVTQE